MLQARRFSVNRQSVHVIPLEDLETSFPELRAQAKGNLCFNGMPSYSYMTRQLINIRAHRAGRRLETVNAEPMAYEGPRKTSILHSD